ncbi:MAG: hypothetical protein AAF675_01105 [Pseudomonadota bacterium]
MAGSAFVGVICGLESERRALGPGLLENPGLRVAVSGARPAAAERAAAQMVSAGARLLVSWGLCGALSAGLATGTLVVPRAVVRREGAQVVLHAPEGLIGAAGAQPIDRLYGSDEVVLSPHAKQALAVATGAAVVDMETHRVAAASAAGGIPCLALRAVSDAAGRALPALAANAVDEAGRPRILAVLGGLLQNPGDVAALIRAGRDANAAHAALSRAVPALTTAIKAG